MRGFGDIPCATCLSPLKSKRDGRGHDQMIPCLSVCQSICLFVSFSLSVCAVGSQCVCNAALLSWVSTYIPAWLPTNQTTCMPICLPDVLSFWLTGWLLSHLSVFLCLHTYLPICACQCDCSSDKVLLVPLRTWRGHSFVTHSPRLIQLIHKRTMLILGRETYDINVLIYFKTTVVTYFVEWEYLSFQYHDWKWEWFELQQVGIITCEQSQTKMFLSSFRIGPHSIRWKWVDDEIKRIRRQKSRRYQRKPALFICAWRIKPKYII